MIASSPTCTLPRPLLIFPYLSVVWAGGAVERIASRSSFCVQDRVGSDAGHLAGKRVDAVVAKSRLHSIRPASSLRRHGARFARRPFSEIHPHMVYYMCPNLGDRGSHKTGTHGPKIRTLNVRLRSQKT